MRKRADLTGKRFGRLLILGCIGVSNTDAKYNVNLLSAKCDCGNICTVRQHGKKVKAQSCGCLPREIAAKRCATLNKITDYHKYVKDRIRITDSGCWEWTGTLWAQGYARSICISAQTKGRGHRLTFELYKEPIIDGNVICHRCDNVLCVNPDHLFQGTTQDNLTDMVNKGRSSRGETHPKAILTLDMVKMIKERRKDGAIKIARELGVGDCCVRDVIKGRSWKHV